MITVLSELCKKLSSVYSLFFGS